MLERGATLQDVQAMINPPIQKSINLEELKAYKDLFVNQTSHTPLNVSVPLEESSTDWGSIISSGLQIIPELLKNRNEVKQNDSEYGNNKAGSLQDSGTVQQEITRNTIQSSSNSQESGIIIPTEQSFN